MLTVFQSSDFQLCHKLNSISSPLLVFCIRPHWPPWCFQAFPKFHLRAFALVVHTAWWAHLPGWMHGSHSHRPLFKPHSDCRGERQGSGVPRRPGVLHPPFTLPQEDALPFLLSQLWQLYLIPGKVSWHSRKCSYWLIDHFFSGLSSKLP